MFKKWIKLEDNGFKNIQIPESKEWRNKGLVINLQGKKIQLELLFSPSPTARRSANRIKEFRNYLEDHPNATFDEFRIDWYKQKLPKI